MQKLTSYPRRIVEFMGTHKESERIMSLNKWREIIGVNPNMEDKYFKRRIKEAIEELKNNCLIENAEIVRSTSVGEVLKLKINNNIFNGKTVKVIS